jgi:hypothetical protein
MYLFLLLYEVQAAIFRATPFYNDWYQSLRLSAWSRNSLHLDPEERHFKTLCAEFWRGVAKGVGRRPEAARSQGVEGSGMASPSNTLENPWPPLAIRPCLGRGLFAVLHLESKPLPGVPERQNTDEPDADGDAVAGDVELEASAMVKQTMLRNNVIT